MAVATPSRKKQKVSSRQRMIRWVRDQYDLGLSDEEIKELAAETFASDKQMVTGALEFFAAWAMSDNSAIQRKKAVKEALASPTVVGVFDALEGYLSSIDGRLFAITDMTRPQLLAARERLPELHGEINRIEFMTAVANELPNDKITVGQYFKTKAKRSRLQEIVADYYEMEE